jgi:predicted GNAT family N-acyltransferase
MTRDLPDRAPVAVRVAETEAEREACFALRYQVYVEELGCDIPTADHHRKLDCTEEDESAVHLYVSCGGGVIGTMRIHHGATSEIPLRFHEGCELHRFLPDTPITQMVAIGRLAIDAGQRGGTAIVPLFQEGFRFLMESHPTTRLAFILPMDEPRLIRMHRLLGFQAIDPNKRCHLDTGRCLPMFARIAASDSPSRSR